MDLPIALAQVEAVYRDLETIPVERSCTRRSECCHFRLTGKTPHVTRGEAAIVARALRRKGWRRLGSKPDGACPLLVEGADGLGCAAYEARPFGCRTHFCAAAGGPLSRREVIDLVRRLEAVDRALGGDGPHDLPAAVALALADRPAARSRSGSPAR